MHDQLILHFGIIMAVDAAYRFSTPQIGWNLIPVLA